MKRDARTPFYDIMCRVEEDCTLAIYFNKVINELDIVKILFAPKHLKIPRKKIETLLNGFIRVVYGNCGFIALYQGFTNGMIPSINTFLNTKGSGNFMLVQKGLNLSTNMEVKNQITMRTAA